MAGVRVTVKSKLPEFRGLTLNDGPIDPNITWGVFFRSHPEVDFKPKVHRIRSSRNTALARDRIQETSDLFYSNSILVNITRIDPASRSPPIPRIPRGNSTRRSSRRGTGGHSGIPLSGNEIPGVEIPIPIAICTVSGGRRNLTGSPGTRRSATGQRSEIPLQIVPEELLNLNGNVDGLQHLNYAASMASQESLETEIIGSPGSNQSVLKSRVLAEIGKIPNPDFVQMFRELKNLAAGDQRYRWSRKAPMVGNMMFQAFAI